MQQVSGLKSFASSELTLFQMSVLIKIVSNFSVFVYKLEAPSQTTPALRVLFTDKEEELYLQPP